ncbi:MAG: alpha/beta hydrolase, partial [Pirellulales bacterium]|nr:alpha/beta hydrolase [Pirellulales bacterium]
ARPPRPTAVGAPTPATSPAPSPKLVPGAEPSTRPTATKRTYPLNDPIDPGRSVETPAAGDDPALKHDKPGYTTVKVFYATDRECEYAADWTKLGTIPWEYLTTAAGCFTFLMLLVLAFKRNRYTGGLFLLGTAATVGLFLCTYMIPRNTKPQETHLAEIYGNNRGTLEVGTCEVSIPEEHKVGEIERPSILRLEFNEDPTKHVVLIGVERKTDDKFFTELKKDISKSTDRQTFIFIHGYNVTFDGAALRTAQLKYDLKFDGPAIFYSWPSQGGLLKYTVDEENVKWTVPHLEQFIIDIVKKTGAKHVHLIAHSMGNRALTAALQRLSQKLKPQELPMFNEVVLTAPDIDADIFRDDIAPAIIKTAKRVTLYASSNDSALAASKKLHGNPRAGESGKNLVIVPGIDTIDVSEIDTSLLGHTYYGDNDTVITDIVQVLHESKPPNLRERLREARLNGHRYWVFLINKNAEP